VRDADNLLHRTTEPRPGGRAFLVFRFGLHAPMVGTILHATERRIEVIFGRVNGCIKSPNNLPWIRLRAYTLSGALV
jgi:hypothetical protein